MKLPCLFDNYHVIMFKLHVSRMTKGMHVISITWSAKPELSQVSSLGRGAQTTIPNRWFTENISKEGIPVTRTPPGPKSIHRDRFATHQSHSDTIRASKLHNEVDYRDSTATLL